MIDRRLPAAPVALLLRQLAAGLHAGQALPQAVATLGRWSSASRHCRPLCEALDAAAPGHTMAEALGAFPATFPPEAVALVADSERRGHAVAALEILAEAQERRVQNWRNLGGALAWPMVALGWLVLMVVVVSVFVVPAFREAFQSFGADLPLPTLLLIGFADLVTVWWLPGLLLAAAGLWFLRSGRMRTFRPVWLSDAALRLPVVGPYLVSSFLLRLGRLLEPVVDGQLAAVPVLAYLRATAGPQALAARARALETAVAAGQALPEAVGTQIEGGGDLALALEFDGPGATGSRMLGRTLDLLEAEVLRKRLRLQQVLVVVFYLAMGLAVGSFVFALYLPIFKLGSVV
jgi:type IV pilus assembly protein PilC